MPNKYEDNEELWQQINPGNAAIQYFRHTELDSLYRIIDIGKETIKFVDTARISKISDINRMLSKDDNPERNKELYLGICNRVLDLVNPIKMPYTPDGPTTAYIETFPGYLGVLYFKDSQDNMIEAKKFFKGPWTRGGRAFIPTFKEISYHDYILAQQEYYEKEIKEIEDANNRSDASAGSEQ